MYIKYSEEGVEEIEFLVIFVSQDNGSGLESININYALNFF